MNRKQEITKDAPMIVDGALMGITLWGCYLLRSSGLIHLDFGTTVAPFAHYYWMLAVVVPLTPLLLDMQRFYGHSASQKLDVLLSDIAKAGLWLAVILGFCTIFGRLEVPSRTVLLLFLLLSPLILLTRVVLTRRVLLYFYSLGRIGERSVLVGTTKDCEAFVRGLSTAEKVELQITQRFDPTLEDVQGIRKSIRQHTAGRVIFVSPECPGNEDLPETCEAEGLEVWIHAPNINGLLGVPDILSAGRTRVLVFRISTADFWYGILKRIMDVTGALLGILLLLPAALVIAAVVKLTSEGPVIFRQVRSGKRGRRFTILKFRSMVESAPQLHAGLNAENEMEGPVFKISKDPRVTPFGAFLRSTSLDEIPQLWNVLVGEMSLVGPRPLPDYETERIEKSAHRRRLSVKPGLTCIWQIRGRNSIRSFEDWVQLDLEYIDRASILLDLSILLQTVPAVLFRRGAR